MSSPQPQPSPSPTTTNPSNAPPAAGKRARMLTAASKLLKRSASVSALDGLHRRQRRDEEAASNSRLPRPVEAAALVTPSPPPLQQQRRVQRSEALASAPVSAPVSVSASASTSASSVPLEPVSPVARPRRTPPPPPPTLLTPPTLSTVANARGGQPGWAPSSPSMTASAAKLTSKLNVTPRPDRADATTPTTITITANTTAPLTATTTASSTYSSRIPHPPPSPARNTRAGATDTIAAGVSRSSSRSSSSSGHRSKIPSLARKKWSSSNLGGSGEKCTPSLTRSNSVPGGLNCKEEKIEQQEEICKSTEQRLDAGYYMTHSSHSSSSDINTTITPPLPPPSPIIPTPLLAAVIIPPLPEDPPRRDSSDFLSTTTFLSQPERQLTPTSSSNSLPEVQSWSEMASTAASMDSSKVEQPTEVVTAVQTPQTPQTTSTAITVVPAEKGEPRIALYEALYSIEGMTCAACTGKVQETVESIPGVKQVEVALLTNSATVRFEGLKEDAAKVVDEIEDIGFECTLAEVKELNVGPEEKTVERTAMIKIEGMKNVDGPRRVIEILSNSFPDMITVNKPPTVEDPVLSITYLPIPPTFTIRHIIAEIDGTDPAFSAKVHHQLTIEERSRKIQQSEFRKLAIRLIICLIIAIPTFMIGIVWMTLVPRTNAIRRYLEEPMWVGNSNRLEWALFFLATPVQFFIADVFHTRAIKELRALWRPGSSVPIAKRFYKFGSMHLLISLGVSIAYFASVGLLAMAATTEGKTMGHHTTYFDSTVFLTMFLLLGKVLEAYSKSKTADAVSMLGKLRPSEALLLVDEPSDRVATASSLDDDAVSVKSGKVPPQQARHVETSHRGIQRIPIDMLEVGDTILVQNGGSPPADGKISVGQTKFDESSLTGESKPVMKNVGDEVFAGTINRGNAVNVVISAVDGESMLDQIVKVVREGQTRRAPIERVADMITGYFVPIVTLIAITTWVVWLALGMTGHLPPQYLDVDQGGWPVWSLGFAISVFVVACPCGIGLAAPTALFVGSGLAAKFGILAKGGGEAFQEASLCNVVVFDKTGTLTEGGEPRVADERTFGYTDGGVVYTVAMILEEASSHPLARALVGFCEQKPRPVRAVIGGNGEVEEVPGRGMKGTIDLLTVEEGNGSKSPSYEAIIGNEAFMIENGVPPLDGVVDALLYSWKAKGKSVVLLAMREISDTPTGFTLAAVFSATDPIRKETRSVIQYLQNDLNMQVWLISGDNHTTTQAVAAQVGIPASNVVASVLPHEKAIHVHRIQQLPSENKKYKRNIVAMVGDGINDAPALSTSDVAIAIGSGSDIALSTSSFVLLNSDLWGVVRLIHLSRTVLSRIRWNFGWACIYNMIAVPVAAGVLYPIGMRGWRQDSNHLAMMEMEVNGMDHVVGTGGTRIRLDPVWASLAMALSSVSVVCSSLLLRTRWYGVGFRPVIAGGKSEKGEKGKLLDEKKERLAEEGMVV